MVAPWSRRRSTLPPGRAETHGAMPSLSFYVRLLTNLSLMAAFCSHEFVAAHEQLGRNRPAPPAE